MMVNVVVQLEFQKYKNSVIEPASPYCIEGGGGVYYCIRTNLRQIGKKTLKLILVYKTADPNI